MSKTIVFLTGGLGNQLFQLTVGLSRPNSELMLEWKLGNPHLNRQGKPDISDFILPQYVQIPSQYRKNKLLSKLSGYLLRQGMEPTRVEKLFSMGRIVSRILEVFLFFRYGNRFLVRQATNNGYFQIPQVSEFEYLIGYFQSYKWVNLEGIEAELKNLKLINPSMELQDFITKIQKLETAMVHVRLGDYRQHTNFGIPSKKYYRDSLNQLLATHNIESILLFSNEPVAAMNFVPQEFQKITYVVPSFSESSAETLEAMRHAKHYVIGNSSLSWWGAKLSYSNRPTIIAPNPWFKLAKEPKDLVPLNWIRNEAFRE